MPTATPKGRDGSSDSRLESPGSWLNSVPRKAVWWASAALAAAVIVCILFWGWFTDGESNSATIRNLGLVGIVPLSFWLAMWRNRIAQSQAATARGGLLNERYQKAAEMLAGSTPLVRIAGVHALQQIAQESPDMHRRQAIRLLAAFVRHPPRDNEPDSLVSPAGSDVKSALEAIHACRTYAAGPAVELDLRGANLKQLKLDWIGLHGADLSGASLHGVRFDDVDLSGAELAGADLRDAQLSGPEPQIPCVLIEANLSGANMAGADLIGVDMRHSNLSGAILVGAHLDSADLRHADLTDADLTDTSLAFAKLAGASLASAILANTDLSGADFFTDDEALHDTSPIRGLRQTQLDTARAERDWPPKLGDAVKDTATGHPLTWHQTID